MKGNRLIIILALALIVPALGSYVSAAGRQQRVGLVLSGGGARGIAEIGVIQALEENNIPIDYITGTSIGAIVGGLYAAGYSPAEMMELIKSKMFMEASTGSIDPRYRYQFFKPEPKPALLNLNMSPHTSVKPHLSDADEFLVHGHIRPLYGAVRR